MNTSDDSYNQNKRLIPRISNYSQNLLDRSKQKILEPVIIIDAIDHWLAASLWTPDFFKFNYGNIQTETNHDLPNNLSPYLYEEQSYHTKIMSFADFIEQIPKSKSCYIAQSEVSGLVGIDHQYNFYDLIPDSEHNKKVNINLWFGFNTRSGLHFDYNDNFLAQIYGKKKVYLAPPQDTKYLYSLPENFTKTQVNPMDPDFERFPMLKYATIFEGEIKAGDVLYIPKGWYHYIFSPEVSISLNCWYGTSLRLRDMMGYFYRSGIKIWARFIYDFIWQGIFGRPFKGKIYCSDTMGKRAYQAFLNQFKLY